MSINFPLLFFCLLIPLSGFIAWAGDRVGHRIGKRRHTFLSLRPRHTAMLMTIAAGMFISLVSFGLMWASNDTFRVVLREGDALLQHNRELKGQNSQLRTDVMQEQRLAGQMREEARRARGEAEASLAARDLALKAKSAAEKNLGQARSQVATAQTTLARAAADLAGARSDLRLTKTELQQKEARVEQARTQVHVAEQRQRAAQAAALAEEKRVQLADKQIAKAKGVFELVTAQQKTAIDKQKQELSALTHDLDTKRVELSALEIKRAELSAKLGESLTSTTALRRNKVTYHVDEEVERASLPAGMTTADIQMALWRLLTGAADKAVERGAAAAVNGRAVVILAKPVKESDVSPVKSSDGDGGEYKILDEADSVAAAADAIRSAGEDVAVFVVASANAVEGEPVPVEFRTFRNNRVLRQNAVVGVITLDGTRPERTVAESLYTFLRRDVRKRLLDSGVIPPSLGAHNGSQGADGESIVSISGDRWYQVLDDVRRAGKAAQVVVRAAADLRAADPVALSFEVNPLRGISSARP